MGGQRDRSDLFSIDWIDEGYSAIAESNQDSMADSVVPDVVGIVAEIHFRNLGERFAIVDFARALFVIGNKEAIQLRDEGDTLGRTGLRNGTHPLATPQVDHLDGVVAKRADEQSVASRIESEMVDPTFNSGKRNRAGRSNRRVLSGVTGGKQEREDDRSGKRDGTEV
ncbi:MAG TPA: hypothetical protein VLH83_03715 [Chthoniobacterales bacterium]|nr:hypothetical protein [Chthoniobacterales bacterium]